jgi:hypothetical protein
MEPRNNGLRKKILCNNGSGATDTATMDTAQRPPQQWSLHNGLHNNGLHIAPFYSSTIDYATMVPAKIDSPTINPAKIESATYDPETMLPATMGVAGIKP